MPSSKSMQYFLIINRTIEALPVAILVSEPGNALPNGFFDSALQKLRENGSDQNLSLELSVSQGLTTKGVLKFLNDRVADLPSAANASKTQVNTSRAFESPLD